MGHWRPDDRIPPESNVLTGHVVKRRRRIPGLKRVSGILREVRRSRRRSGSIDGGQQHQIASGIVNLPTAQGKTVDVFVEPEAVIKHIAQKTLLLIGSLIAKATYSSTG